MTVNYRDLLYTWPAKSPQPVAEPRPLEARDPLPDKPKKKEKPKVTLTARDKRLFDVLKRVRCLSQNQVLQLLGATKGAYRNRLRRLMLTGYLKKLTYGQCGGFYGVIWTGGWQLRGELKNLAPRSLFEAEHQIYLNQIYLDLIMNAKEYEALLDWQDGIYAPISFGSNMIRPDAILRFYVNDITVFIEFDRGTKSLKRVDEQIKRYRDYFLSPYSNRKMRLWMITRTPARCHTIATVANKALSFFNDEEKIQVMDHSQVLDKIKALIGPGVIHTQKNPSEIVSPPLMVPLEAVRPFCEEAVSIFYKLRVRLPDSYRAAAAVMFPHGNR